MCGRYVIRRIDLHRIGAEVGPFLPQFEEFSELKLSPRFNVSPSQQVPLIFLHDNKSVVKTASWGFVPHWEKDPAKAKIKPINAKAETVATSGMFRTSFKGTRCLMPADGFYEWIQTTTPKQPVFFHRPDDALFAFAGLRSGDTCLLITTEPNKIVAPVHNRMPVMLHPEDYRKWLDPETKPDELQSLLKPYPAEELISQPVSTRVNSPKNEGPTLLEPAD